MLKLAESNSKPDFSHNTKKLSAATSSHENLPLIEGQLKKFLLLLRISATGNYICADNTMKAMQDEYTRIESSLARQEIVDTQIKELLLHALVRKDWIKIINTTYEDYFNTNLLEKYKEDFLTPFISYCIECKKDWDQPEERIFALYDRESLPYIKVDLYFNFDNGYSFTGNFNYDKQSLKIVSALRYFLFIVKDTDLITKDLAELALFLIHMYLKKTETCNNEIKALADYDDMEQHLKDFCTKYKALSDKIAEEVKYLESLVGVVNHMKPNGQGNKKTHEELKTSLLLAYSSNHQEIYYAVIIMFETGMFELYQNKNHARQTVEQYIVILTNKQKQKELLLGDKNPPAAIFELTKKNEPMQIELDTKKSETKE